MHPPVTDSTFNPQPLALENDIVRLEPVAIEHADALFEASQFDAIWEFHAFGPPASPDGMREWIASRIDLAARQQEIAFAIVEKKSNAIVGSTRYMDISIPNRSLEIGGTWLTPAKWRTAINTNCKTLLLSHAFETLSAVRVFFKTDLRNIRSQKAIERLGAVREGVLRKHLITHTGHIRDSVYYSIVDDEWPEVRARLAGMTRVRAIS